jgi:hypothetical protein
LGGIRVARFPANNAGHDERTVRNRYIKAAEVLGVAMFVARCVAFDVFGRVN